MPRLLSGVRVSGDLHIGNYFGAIKQWVEMQKEYESIVMLADLHALTTPYNPQELSQKTLDTVKLYLACGIDPKKSVIFAQSHVPEHTELTWILATIARMGELQRMVQYKEKGGEQENANLGLFAYPVLMAADILLYQADVVPVGEDQKQHIELTRDLAERFNRDFGQTFKIPAVKMHQAAARIMALDNPEKKMSKSAETDKGYIALLDSPELIREKIKTAVTDSGSEVKFDPKNKPAVSNLITIYSLVTGQGNQEIEAEFAGKNYGEFKAALAESLVTYLGPIQERFHKLTNEEAILVLQSGGRQAQKIAAETLAQTKKQIGLLQI